MTYAEAVAALENGGEDIYGLSGYLAAIEAAAEAAEAAALELEEAELAYDAAVEVYTAASKAYVQALAAAQADYNGFTLSADNGEQSNAAEDAGNDKTDTNKSGTATVQTGDPATAIPYAVGFAGGLGGLFAGIFAGLRRKQR